MDMPTQETTAGRGASQSWLGFLLVAFATVGLAGFFAAFAAPLPLQRQAAREAALDAALVAAAQPEAAAALDRLRPSLGESAAAILAVGPDSSAPDLPARVAAERRAMRGRFAHEADVVASRLRWLVGIVTVMAAAFGVACYQAGRGPNDRA